MKSCPLLPNEPILSQTALGLYDAIMGHENQGYFESNPSWSTADHHISTLLYSLNLLSERVQQTKSLVSQLATSFSIDQHSDLQVDPTSMIRVTGLVQEIVSVSSSMMFTCQQMSLSLDSNLVNGNPKDHIPSISQHDIDQLMESSTDLDRERNKHGMVSHQDVSQEREHDEIAGRSRFGSSDDQSISRWFDRSEEYMNVNLSCDTTKTTTNSTDQTGYYEMIIEMDAADLLAMYRHFCQVCNKGFKRDANLRMHMRAHGDEYKSTAALANPKKNNLDNMMESMSSKLQMAKRYSCPHDGCRWNRKHPKFQPLKSMICVKNHYKRSHCPKMYVCKRCNQKEFSVVSDLRTHEKHCGYLKWRCSCGTTFSRKDKLLGHVRLFAGHFPINQNHGFDDS